MVFGRKGSDLWRHLVWRRRFYRLGNIERTELQTVAWESGVRHRLTAVRRRYTFSGFTARPRPSLVHTVRVRLTRGLTYVRVSMYVRCSINHSLLPSPRLNPRRVPKNCIIQSTPFRDPISGFEINISTLIRVFITLIQNEDIVYFISKPPRSTCQRLAGAAKRRVRTESAIIGWKTSCTYV